MNQVERYEIERREQWREYGMKAMPFFRFPPDWQVCFIAPFGGVLTRFVIKLPSGNTKSVYFDAHDAAGCVGQPYWEVYPYRGDCGRCMKDEADDLIRMIGDEEPGPSYD